MTTELSLDALVEAVSAGGPSCLSSTTRLAPAAGAHASIAPAKFAARTGDGGTYAYERRFLDGTIQDAVLVDSKQSQLNRVEEALRAAIDEGHPTLSRLPRVVVTYERGDGPATYTDLDLPHRVFDGHVRAGKIGETDTTQHASYRAIRDAEPTNARALFDASPASLVFGAWDSSRASRQGRWRSLLVGEIIGFCAGRDEHAMKGGARIDPLGAKIELTGVALKELAEAQKRQLSKDTYDKLIGAASKTKQATAVKPSTAGLGGIAPNLETLGGVACHTIIRSHVLSFAGLRQLRFGAGPEGDAACRALLAALALNGLARSDAELVLRANCDLVEDGPTAVVIDRRGGDKEDLAALDVMAADRLLADALTRAEQVAGVVWDGPVLQVTGNPAILAGAVDDEGNGN